MANQSWIITTAVGTGERGFAGDGGPAATALLNGPFDVGFDPRRQSLFLRHLQPPHPPRRRRAPGSSPPSPAMVPPAIRAMAARPSGPCSTSPTGSPSTAPATSMSPTATIIACAGSTAPRASSRPSPATARRAMPAMAGRPRAPGLAEPNGLGFDPAQQRLFIADVADNRVRVVDLATGHDRDLRRHRRGGAYRRWRPGQRGRRVRRARGQGRGRRDGLHPRTPGQHVARGRPPHRGIISGRRRHWCSRLQRRRRPGARRGVRRAQGDCARPRGRHLDRRYRKPRDPPHRRRRPASSRPSPAATRGPRATAARPPPPGSAARMARSSAPTARSMSATPKTTASASSPAPAEAGLASHRRLTAVSPAEKRPVRARDRRAGRWRRRVPD